MNHCRDHHSQDIALHKPGSTRQRWHSLLSKGLPERLTGGDRWLRTHPDPATLSMTEGAVTSFTSQPQTKASLAPAPALFTCRSQQLFVAKLCTQTCSVMSEMVVYQFVCSKYFLNYAKFLREQGEAQDNFRLFLHFQ